MVSLKKLLGIGLTVEDAAQMHSEALGKASQWTIKKARRQYELAIQTADKDKIARARRKAAQLFDKVAFRDSPNGPGRHEEQSSVHNPIKPQLIEIPDDKIPEYMQSVTGMDALEAIYKHNPDNLRDTLSRVGMVFNILRQNPYCTSVLNRVGERNNMQAVLSAIIHPRLTGNSTDVQTLVNTPLSTVQMLFSLMFNNNSAVSGKEVYTKMIHLRQVIMHFNDLSSYAIFPVNKALSQWKKTPDQPAPDHLLADIPNTPSIFDADITRRMWGGSASKGEPKAEQASKANTNSFKAEVEKHMDKEIFGHWGTTEKILRQGRVAFLKASGNTFTLESFRACLNDLEPNLGSHIVKECLTGSTKTIPEMIAEVYGLQKDPKKTAEMAEYIFKYLQTKIMEAAEQAAE